MHTIAGKILLIGSNFVLLYKIKSISEVRKVKSKKVTVHEHKDGQLLLTIKTNFGMENVLKDELNELGYTDVEVLNRAVKLEGSWHDVYYLNLHLRCAITILVEVANFSIREEDDLYKQCLKIDWTQYFDIKKTFAVKGAVFSNFFKHSQYPFLVVKDAIADTFRKKYDDRPNVNIKAPQVVFDVYINKDEVTISLNTSGAPLFQRGYRQAVGEAPLNEVLAAGLLRLSGWDKKRPLLDVFCGSGTILIEAALLAAGIPSNIERQHYAFKNFANFDADAWDDIYNSATRRVDKLDVKIIGSDINAEMVLKARRNLRGVSVGRFVDVKVASFEELKNLNLESPLVISNPPYGERMGDEIELLYEQLGDWMKAELKGGECWIISSSDQGFKSVGLKPDLKMKLFNGSLECSFRKYSIYEGSKKAKYQE